MQVSLTFLRVLRNAVFTMSPKSVPGLPIEVQFVTKTVVVKVILFQSVSFFRLGLPIIYTNLHIFYKRLFLKRNDIM